MRKIGLEEVEVDEKKAYLTATLPANTDKPCPIIRLLTHLVLILTFQALMLNRKYSTMIRRVILFCRVTRNELFALLISKI